MKYLKICEGIFIERPNRFVALVDVGGERQRVHVKNTGRCRELLVAGAIVYLEDFYGRMGSRKLRYSLVGVRKGNLLINMDSQAPNQVVKEALLDQRLRLPGMETLSLVKGEKTYGSSRLDFYAEDEAGQRAFLEVKGVTLEENGVVSFPDAPTERGIKHIEELIRAGEDGFRAYILFVIQMKGIDVFRPNDRTHPQFGQALRKARDKGVRILAYDCTVSEDSMELSEPVWVEL